MLVRYLLILVLSVGGMVPVAKAQTSDVLLQGFYWNVHPGDPNSTTNAVWWDSLRIQAPMFAGAGVQTVWIPSPFKGSAGRQSMGYDLYDYFDLGQILQKGTRRTRFGTFDQYQAMMQGFRAAGLRVMVDAVLNHRDGADRQALPACGNTTARRWIIFNPGSRRIPADSTHFNPAPPHCDEATPYRNNLFGQDIAYFQNANQVLDASAPNNGWFHGPHTLGDMGDSLVVWGRWLVDPAGAGYDEIRIDAIKHIEPGFLSPWLVELSRGDQPYAVGEYFGSAEEMMDYHRQITTFGSGSRKARMSVFDFDLRFALKEMADAGGGFDMGQLNARGLVRRGFDPFSTTTFVDNHDFDRIGWAVSLAGAMGNRCVEAGAILYGTSCIVRFQDYGHSPVVNRKHLPYAYIMGSEGRPTLFYKDLVFFLQQELTNQMALRTHLARGTSTPMSGLAPFFNPGSNGSDLFVFTRNGSGQGRDGAVIALNDHPSDRMSAWVNTPFANIEMRDYSDAYLFQSTRVFGDSRSLIQADGSNYAWYAPTGLYPRPPSSGNLPFEMTATPGGKLQYVVLRASDAAALRVNGRPLQAGDAVAVRGPNGAGIAGIGRTGLHPYWDGEHDLLIEVLGNEGEISAASRLNNGDALQVVVRDGATGQVFTAGSVTFAAVGTEFSFRPNRPTTRGGKAPFTLTTTHAGATYSVGGITMVTAFSAGTATSADRWAEAGSLFMGVPYPSMATSRISIPLQLPSSVSGTLTLYDVLGRQMQTMAVEAGTTEFQLALADHLAPGAYLLRLDTPAGTAQQRFVRMGW